VRKAESLGVSLDRLPVEKFREVSPIFEADVRQVFDYQQSVERRAASGGTAPAAVAAQLLQVDTWLEEHGV
jgi:argininosuccinate lyase